MAEQPWDWRRFVYEHISTVLLIVLALEMLFLLVLIVFAYLDFNPDDYFYLFSLVTLMVSTAYFGWHSLVKENAFELLAFIVMSSLLSFHGIFRVLSQSTYFPLEISALCVLGFSQLIYYGLFYYAYRHFGWRMVAELRTINDEVVKAFKTFEIFVSLLKIDFMLYTLTVATFWFYLFVYWSDALILWFGLSAALYASLIAFSLIGIKSVSSIKAFKERKTPMKLFLRANPLLSLLKAGTIVMIGKYVTTFILVQSILIAAVDIAVAIAVWVVGMKLYKNFSQGLLILFDAIDESLIVKL
mmetsp:Transcript_22496/g.40533  ORF Transcript_22496/g.40533 Transcript_22496/m.40533 type:complete len:300 (-) Transcript_22496:144-1043(-)